MKVLVIPDVHLKPNMFERASLLLSQGSADQAVCLMDIPDDWNRQLDIDLYERTFDAAISFAKSYPSALWCYGNHDICYLLGENETGYSALAAPAVRRKLKELSRVLPVNNPIRYVQIIDNVLFSHGGVSDSFVRQHIASSIYNHPANVVSAINDLDPHFMWHDDSPLWFRPQYSSEKLYKPRKCLQVVGHTPVREITRTHNLISCDVFSTYRDGRPSGSQEFLLIDTKNWTYSGIPTV